MWSPSDSSQQWNLPNSNNLLKIGKSYSSRIDEVMNFAQARQNASGIQ